jgi:spore coat protein CotH
VTLSETAWADLQADLAQGEEVWYPTVFRYGDEVVADAAIRLRGNNSRCGDKLQFAIGFNQIDRAGRFHGLRRINLDHGGCNLLEERLALSFARDLGLPASCANHARLVVNGAFYGVFLNVEHVNKDFLRRNFGAAFDDGNLYKSGWELQTNEELNDTADLRTWNAAPDAAALARLGDLDEAVVEWAAEAVMPARDNYWLRGWNYYLYHHPERGFLFLPTDLDQAFPGYSADVGSPTLLPDALQRAAALALADPAWTLRYEQAVRRAVDAFDPAVLNGRVDRWWWQVKPSVLAEPVPSWSSGQRTALKERVAGRAAWLRERLAELGW